MTCPGMDFAIGGFYRGQDVNVENQSKNGWFVDTGRLRAMMVRIQKL